MKPDELDDIIDRGNLFAGGGKKNWIPKNLKKGRCTPMGTSQCPKGSPQYNLAKTFKKHHGFHTNGGQIEAATEYYNAQPLYTEALANKYKNVPIKDILQRSVDNSVFHNTRLDQVSDSLRNQYGDISLNKHEIDSLVNKGYPNILDINNNLMNADKEAAGYNANTKGVNEPAPESFGYRMMMQRSYPKGSVPYKYLEKANGGNLMFLGGLTGATAMEGTAEIGGQLSGMINPNTKGGGAASGALKGASMGAALGPYGMAAGAVIGGTVGFINAQNQQNRDAFNEQNESMKQRNQMLGIKAKGGYLIPMGVSPNMASDYKDGGELTEFNNGGSHETNPYQGIPQGQSPDGQTNKVEQGETKWNDYIFSDRLLMDKNMVEQHNLPKSMEGKTFAEVSKSLSKLTKERPNDVISKATHKDYMQRLMMANDTAREAEESMQMAQGGHLYAGGSPLNLKRNPQQTTLGQSSEILNKPFTPGLFFDPVQDKAQLAKSGINPLAGSNGDVFINSKTPFFKDPKNLRYAPIAFDALAATGIFGKSPKPQEYSPTLIQDQGYLAPQQQDEMQMRNAVDASYQTGASALGEAAGGSGAALRAGLSGLNKDYMSSIGKSYGDANRANMAQRQASDQFNLSTQGNIAAQNAQALSQADLYNNQLMNQKKTADYENRMSYLGKGAEGVGDIGYEKRLGDVMSKIYGYDQYGNYTVPLKEKSTAKSCGGKLKLRTRRK